ncbi:hypothetical protein Amac_054830 [Acrocarpospora macrocephala]|uniref:Serine-threonine protein kinase n=1 Tax=Acrocarpospora macrocephala TaxID=150177 RepID=A0A5M3WTN3_9ACTN|nr:hypothetical protein Amac_054830 [Acrocarpospora macrocephala]
MTLFSFDRHGVLRDEHGLLGNVIAALQRTTKPITDVFILSHGWLNDHAQAQALYGDWIRAMADYAHVRQAEIQARRPGFRPLLLGVHWPSAPWENPRTLVSLDQKVAFFTDLIGDRSAADDLGPLLEDAQANPDPDTLSAQNEDRLHRIDEKSGLRKDQVGALPGDDRGDFDAGRIFADYKRTWRDAVGDEPLRSALSPLWVTSFWKMKRRALDVGGLGVHTLLKTLQAADESHQVRFHLAGHSFGGIVMSAALQGPPGGQPLARPAHSLALLQGALSHWSFARRIPDTERSGYFHPVIAANLVSGPMVVTRSAHDRALGWFYRMAATLTRDVHLNRRAKRLPHYGAIGTYGLAGLTDAPLDLVVRPGQLRYRLEPGRRYNVDGSAVIVSSSFSVQGGHSNLVHPELAAVIWEAATTKPA